MPSASIGIANASAPAWRRRAQRRAPRWRFDREHVARIEEGAARERDRLHAAEREHHRVAVDGAPFEPERAFGDAVAQHLVAPADAVAPGRAVLQRVGGVVAEHVGR